jgi:PhoPQ-activated pathogenicity-related protein
MDIVQDFLVSLGVNTSSKFILSGASKRGWTSWLTTAIDSERVIASVPIVFDAIDLNKVFI